MRLRFLWSVALVCQTALWASPGWAQSGSGESQTGRLESVRPRLTGIAVPGLRTVTATFSEPLFSPGTSVPSNYALSGPGRGTLGSTPGGSAGGSGPIRLDWNSGEMRNGAAITLSVSGLQDAVGNPINPSFATAGGTGLGVAPVFSGLVVQPTVAGAGQEVLLRFTASEPLSGPPLVRVGGVEALRLEEPGYVYAYTVAVEDPLGPTTVSISGQDDAGNPGSLSVPGALEVVRRVAVAPGESVQAVINDLPADEPALVVLEPGDYDEALVLRPGVRLVGSGPETRLAPSLDALGADRTVLTGADRASAESLTVVLPGEETTGVLAVDAAFTVRELAVEGGMQAGTVGIAIVGSGAKGAGEAVSVVRDCALAQLDLALDVDGAEALVSFNVLQDIFGAEAVRASGANGLLPSLGSLDDLVNTGSNTFEGIAGDLYAGPAAPGALAQANYWDNLAEEAQVQARVTGGLDAAKPLYFDETGKDLIPASLFVTVLDAATDTPVPGARVTLVYNLAPLPEAAGAGVYSSAALSSGRYTVRVRKEGYDEAVELVELSSGVNEAVVYLGTPGGTEGEGEGATEGEGEGANEGEGDGNTEGEGEGEPPAPTPGCNCQGGAKGLPAAPGAGDLLVGLAAIGTLLGLGLQRRAQGLARAGAALLLAGAMFSAPTAGAQCTEVNPVSNVSFVQRPTATGTEVLITYDLSDLSVGPWNISVSLSKNGGADGYPFPVTTLTGQREAVQAGAGRTLLWDFASDYPEQDISQARLRVTAVQVPLYPGLKVPVGTSPTSITVGDFNGDGKPDLATANYLGDDVSVLLGDGAGGFAPEQSFAVGNAPLSLTVGDFNGDGAQDLATANYYDDVSVLLGDGAGGFAAYQRFNVVGNRPLSITVGDFNGDGKQDLATANAFSGDVSVLLGDGAGRFAAQQRFAAGDGPTSVTVGDFNGDGKPDLATANGISDDVSVLLGDGAGGFAAQQRFAVGDLPYSETAQDSPQSITVGDFNGDGKPDLATANAFSADVSVLLGDGAGGFAPEQRFAAGDSPYSVTVGDFNGDGKQDLATTNEYSNDISVLLGDGAGGFAAQQRFAVGDLPLSITVGDFNGDGQQDLATANNYGDDVSVQLGDGAGGFTAQQRFAVGNRPLSLTVGDFNGDLAQDLATANYYTDDVSVLLGDGAGGFAPEQRFAVGYYPSSVTVGDFNGDGAQDLATANGGYNGNEVSVLLGDGAGGFAPEQRYAVGYSPISLTVGDFNGDGAQDLATANSGSNGNDVSVLLGDGSGGFAPEQRFAVGDDRPFSITVGDFNGDGKPDLATANRYGSNVSVLLGDGAGGFAAPRRFALGYYPFSITVGDFNGDGKQDLATANNYSYSNEVSVLLGDGAGGFTAQQRFSVGNGPTSLTVGDFNGDGQQDLATANYYRDDVSVLLGDGTGCFAAEQRFAAGSSPYSLTVGDFNGDGKQDLATANSGIELANSGSDDVSVLLHL